MASQNYSNERDPYGGINPEAMKKDRSELAARFAKYASRHDRKDLAELALRDVRKFESGTRGGWFGDIFFGTPSKTIGPMITMHWIGGMLLRAMVFCGLAWLILGVVLLRFRKTSQWSVSFLDVASSVTFALVACIIVFVAILLNSGNWMELIYAGASASFYAGLEKPVVNIVSRLWVWMPLGLTIPYCLVVILWRSRKDRRVLAPPQPALPENQSVSAQAKSSLRWSGIRLGAVALCYLFVWMVSLLFNLQGVGINNEIQFLLLAPLLLILIIST